MRLTELLAGVGQTFEKMGILPFRLFFNVGHFFEGTSGGGWSVFGQPVHSRGVEGGVTRHIQSGVVGGCDRGLVVVLVGDLDSAGILLGL